MERYVVLPSSSILTASVSVDMSSATTTQLLHPAATDELVGFYYFFIFLNPMEKPNLTGAAELGNCAVLALLISTGAPVVNTFVVGNMLLKLCSILPTQSITGLNDAPEAIVSV